MLNGIVEFICLPLSEKQGREVHSPFYPQAKRWAEEVWDEWIREGGDDYDEDEEGAASGEVDDRTASAPSRLCHRVH